MVEYKDRLEKRAVQSKIFPLIKRDKLITLAGPNVKDYLSMVPDIKSVEIWENKAEIMLKQLMEIKDFKGKDIIYNFGDIYNAEVDPSAFYDLDFCATIKSVEGHIRKFKDCAYSITLSNRACIFPETMDIFFKIIGEEVQMNIPHPQFNHITTDKGVYLATTYCDTSPMTNIFKFH